MPIEPTSETALVSQILALVGEDPGAFEPARGAEDLFRHATKKQLLDCAQRLGMAGVAKLGKEELAVRIQAAFEGLVKPARPTDDGTAVSRIGDKIGDANGGPSGDKNGGGSFPQKFDLGPIPEAEVLPHNIPWGYGLDRVTAMAVDPNRLFVYWEVTDDAVAKARAALGGGGHSAWLDLRVYDITGRLFDGTNAHSYFDHRVERHDRQWFFEINKPTSNTCAEIGLLSHEGYFAKIARSGRVEFPRGEPVGGGTVEWLSVRTASGEVGLPVASSAPPRPGGAPAGAGDAGGGGGGAAAQGGEPPPVGEGWNDWTPEAGFPVPGGQRLFGRRWEWQEQDGTQWTSELARTEWAGPLLRTEWEAGPFAYPVDAPSLVEIRNTGELSVRTEGGHVHVMYGPWQVVIRGIGARAERRLLATWEYRRQVEVTGGAEQNVFTQGKLVPGSSEWLLMGASERAWMGASELLYRGASELWLLGASELRLGGASETLYAGASEYRMRGASERLLAGASERRLRGASELRLGGASEIIAAGSSERRLGGASENFLGASERLGGASERSAPPPPEGSYPYPPLGPLAETD